MSLDAKNVVILTGGLTRDPEKVTDNITKFSIAVDRAGSEAGSSNNSGYFDVVFFTNNDDMNTKFVRGQIEAGNLSKGSQVSIVGSLRHERWTTDSGKNSKVTIVLESLSYAGSRSESKAGAASTSGGAIQPEDF